VTCFTASDLSLLETLEQKLTADLSVTVLAELERELFRLRCELSRAEWDSFCLEFPKRSIFPLLQMGTLTRKRLSGSQLVPPDVLDTVLSDSGPAHLISAWEHSLPASRSVRARVGYFSREIAEVIRIAVKPRILVLGAGQMREASDALYAMHLHHAEFVALEPDLASHKILQRKYPRQSLQLEKRGWRDLAEFAASAGLFDLIYSPSWLDATDDAQALAWLPACMEMLRPGGRLLAANFAPASRDAGWMEACWNWHPFYRSEEDLAQLVINLKHPEVRGHAIFRDESGASAYLEIHLL